MGFLFPSKGICHMQDLMFEPNTIEEAAEALRNGEPVIFPTDTVYGVGLSVEAALTPDLLYEIKGREHGKPIAWLVDGPSALDRYGVDVPAYAYALAQAFWPGCITLIVKASPEVAAPFRSPIKTIGLRMPDNPTALTLIAQSGAAVATTSANVSGKPAAGSFADLEEELLMQVAAAVRDDAPKSGVASTVVDCTGPAPLILRTGDITAQQIEQVCAACGVNA